MGQRVLFAIAGAALYFLIDEYVGVRPPIWLVVAPLLLAEVLGLLRGPYEKTARDMMHEENEPPKDEPRATRGK